MPFWSYSTFAAVSGLAQDRPVAGTEARLAHQPVAQLADDAARRLIRGPRREISPVSVLCRLSMRWIFRPASTCEAIAFLTYQISGIRARYRLLRRSTSSQWRLTSNPLALNRTWPVAQPSGSTIGVNTNTTLRRRALAFGSSEVMNRAPLHHVGRARFPGMLTGLEPDGDLVPVVQRRPRSP